jgi:hypothetical protein
MRRSDDRLEVIFIAGASTRGTVFLYGSSTWIRRRGAWAELDRLILRKFHRRDRVHPLRRLRHRPAAITAPRSDFCRKRRGRKIFATKGVAGKRSGLHPGRSKNNDPFGRSALSRQGRDL